jgi:hypothetical protein
MNGTLKSKSLSVYRRVVVSFIVLFPKNVKPQERRWTRPLILRNSFEKESEVLKRLAVCLSLEEKNFLRGPNF